MTRRKPVDEQADDRVTLAPLNPEEALRALLAVKPDDARTDDDPSAEEAKKDPAHKGPGE